MLAVPGVDSVVVGVFGLVYLGMMLGSLPRLAIDRTGIAVLGAIVLLASGRIGLAEAWQAIDVPRSRCSPGSW